MFFVKFWIVLLQAKAAARQKNLQLMDPHQQEARWECSRL